MTGKEETGIFTLYSDVEATAVRMAVVSVHCSREDHIAARRPRRWKVYHDDESDCRIIKGWNYAGWKVYWNASESHLPVFGR